LKAFVSNCAACRRSFGIKPESTSEKYASVGWITQRRVVQIAADMFNLPASRMATSEIAALGAAMDAA